MTRCIFMASFPTYITKWFLFVQLLMTCAFECNTSALYPMCNAFPLRMTNVTTPPTPAPYP